MLDQNTDRMWYVIGAVLFGAAIIFGMNTLMPNAFASVGDMFESVTNSTSSLVDDLAIDRNMIDIENVVVNRRVRETDGVLIVDSMEKSTDFMPVRAGYNYVFSTPNAIVKRVSYYSDNSGSPESFIKGYHVGSTKDWVTEAPVGAKYARISADYNGSNHAAIEDWVFSRAK